MTVRWTDVTDARLMSLREDGHSYTTISAQLNIGRDACRSRVGFLKRKSERVIPLKNAPWSAADLATLMRLGGASDNFDRFNEIAQLLGRSAAAVRQQFNMRTRAISRIGVPDEPRPSAAIGTYQIPRDLPKPASLTAAFFGDPLPGRSALDRKQQFEPEGMRP